MDWYKLSGDATKPQWSLRSLLENISLHTDKEITRRFSIHVDEKAGCNGLLSVVGRGATDAGVCAMISPFHTSLWHYRTSLILKSLDRTRSVSYWETRNFIWTAANCIKVVNALNAQAEICCADMPTLFHCNMALSSLKFILENHTIEL